MGASAVTADRLTKIYRAYRTPWDRLFEAAFRRPRHREFRALDDVTFSLPKGEGLAVIGENGAGKSTLLKILAGITSPSSGTLQVNGKIASILELGSGFHPEFTGRQNIVLNAAMLGLTEDEIRRKTPEIIGFSELGDFIDQPVKVYSTGMAMRLGFSIATQVEPDVLIIDEALSVGDGYFQKKCMDRLRLFVDLGGTLLFCSHAMYYVSSFCERALWMRRGRAEALGPVLDVVRDYEDFLTRKSGHSGDGQPPAHGERLPEVDRRPARLTKVSLSATDREATYAADAPWGLEIGWESHDPALAFHIGVGINRSDGVEVFSFATHLDCVRPHSGEKEYSIGLSIPKLPLVKGEFTVYVFLLDEAGLHIYDQRVIERAFQVQGSTYGFGLVKVDHAWQLNDDLISSVQQASLQRAHS
jgi:lipopolysaccharide transport system ATP-binding protein